MIGTRLTQIKGLHHVTSLASDARQTNEFFTKTLGLRRVKKTVNFDRPEVYHLYYGDETGTASTVMTYFPIPDKNRGKPGNGETGSVSFSVPAGSLDMWRERLDSRGVSTLAMDEAFGENRLHFSAPDGDSFYLVETAKDHRQPWVAVVPDTMAIHGFHSVCLRLADGHGTADLLQLMGYKRGATEGAVTRFALDSGYGANLVDLEMNAGLEAAQQGAGSVHHVAFAVENRARQLEVRAGLVEAGFKVTDVIDRDYFWAIYFRSPGGVLFEVATCEPGFERDEDRDHLGEALKLPKQHTHLRERLEKSLPDL